MQLKRNISKMNLLFLSIGSIVGSGWLFGSFYTAQVAGPAAILSWILGGFLVSVIALTFAELSTMFPMSGSSVVFSLLSHGKLTGSIFAWVTWIWTLVIVPIEVQAVLQYSANYIPNLMQTIESTTQLTNKGLLFAFLLMIFLTAVNFIGVKMMAETNKMVVIWKLIIPIVAAYYLLTYDTNPSNLTSQGFAPYGITGILSGIAIGGVSFSFFGFQTAIFMAGEAKNPQKSIPFALFGSIIACMLLYVALQLGFILSLEPENISAGWKSISFSGDTGPFAGIFVGLGLSFMVKVLYFDAILSPLGTAIGFVASSSRIIYSMSLQNDAPKFVGKVNRFSIPWVAITINFVFGMLFFLPFSGWQSMIAFLSAAIVITLACGPICLPIFRKQFPNLERPFKLPFANAMSFLAFYICNLMLQWTGWNTLWKLNLVVALAIAITFMSHFFSKEEEKTELNIKSSFWFIVYLALSSLVSYLGTYDGGIGVISFQWDFLVVAITSAIVFFIAQKSALTSAQANEIYAKIKNNHGQVESI